MFSSELSLRQWLEHSLSLHQIPFIKNEPSLNSTFGIPDYHITYNSYTIWLELKHAKPASPKSSPGIFHSPIRPNQKKHLKLLQNPPTSHAGILLSTPTHHQPFAIRIRKNTLTSTFDLNPSSPLSLINHSPNIINPLAISSDKILALLDFIIADTHIILLPIT